MCVKDRPQTREKMPRQVRFSDKVSQAVCNTNTGTEHCIVKFERCELAEEDEVNARSSEFQLRQQKKSLYQYHLNKRKKSRLHMRHEILEVFWTTYEEEAWKSDQFVCKKEARWSLSTNWIRD